MKCKKIVFSMITIGFLAHGVVYAEETESTSNDYYSNYGSLSLNTNALNTTLGTSLQNDIATVVPITAEKTVAPQSLNLQQPANMVTLDVSTVRNSINQEILATAPTVPSSQSETDTSYAGDYSLSWGGNIVDHFGSGPFETSPDGAAPKRGVSLVFQGGAISQTKLLTQSKATYFGDYNYVAWGTWNSTSVASDPGGGGGGIPFKAFWVATQMTILETQPKTGTATYNGEVQGVLSYDTPLGGSIALNANFGTNALTGTMNITKVSDGSTWKTTTFNTSIITEGDGEHMRFETKLNGTNVVNNTNTYKDSKIMGSFAGPQAAEVGGTWNITTTDDKVAVGAFRAKKQ